VTAKSRSIEIQSIDIPEACCGILAKRPTTCNAQLRWVSGNRQDKLLAPETPDACRCFLGIFHKTTWIHVLKQPDAPTSCPCFIVLIFFEVIPGSHHAQMTAHEPCGATRSSSRETGPHNTTLNNPVSGSVVACRLSSALELLRPLYSALERLH